MMSEEGVPYKCEKCNKIFPAGQYLDFLKHKKEFNH